MSPERRRGIRSFAYREALAFEALNLAREGRMSRAAASRRVGLSPTQVMRHTGPAWRKVGGRWKPKAHDALPRQMVVLRPDGPSWQTIRGSRQASLNASYHNAVRRYLELGDVAGLESFEDKTLTVDGRIVPFVTDLHVLDRLAAGAELHYELYRR